MDQLQQAASWLAGVRDACISQTVIYRDGEQSVAVQATFGSSILKVADGHGGVKVERTEADFVITAARLDFGAGPFRPKRGNTIDVTTPAGRTLRYEVAAPAREPEFRKADPYGVTLRVHTKFKEAL